MTLPLPLPMTAEAARVVRRRLGQMQRLVGDVGVENSVAYFLLGDALDEPRFLMDCVRAPGCHLLLDLHNVYTMALNFGFRAGRVPAPARSRQRSSRSTSRAAASRDPRWLPSGRVLRLDGHDGAVPELVWRMLEAVAPRCPNLRGVTLERMEGTRRGRGRAAVGRASCSGCARSCSAAASRCAREAGRLRAAAGGGDARARSSGRDARDPSRRRRRRRAHDGAAGGAPALRAPAARIARSRGVVRSRARPLRTRRSPATTPRCRRAPSSPSTRRRSSAPGARVDAAPAAGHARASSRRAAVDGASAARIVLGCAADGYGQEERHPISALVRGGLGRLDSPARPDVPPRHRLPALQVRDRGRAGRRAHRRARGRRRRRGRRRAAGAAADRAPRGIARCSPPWSRRRSAAWSIRRCAPRCRASSTPRPC